jgi:hypothetical protein
VAERVQLPTTLAEEIAANQIVRDGHYEATLVEEQVSQQQQLPTGWIASSKYSLLSSLFGAAEAVGQHKYQVSSLT